MQTADLNSRPGITHIVRHLETVVFGDRIGSGFECGEHIRGHPAARIRDLLGGDVKRVEHDMVESFGEFAQSQVAPIGHIPQDAAHGFDRTVGGCGWPRQLVGYRAGQAT